MFKQSPGNGDKTFKKENSNRVALSKMVPLMAGRLRSNANGYFALRNLRKTSDFNHLGRSSLKVRFTDEFLLLSACTRAL